MTEAEGCKPQVFEYLKYTPVGLIEHIVLVKERRKRSKKFCS